VKIASGIVQVGGVIGVDTTWTTGRTYVVTQDILVANAVTLTIEPGVTVKADGAHTMQINGTLIAIGTPSQKITFEGTAVAFAGTPAVYDQEGNYLGGSTMQFARVSGTRIGVLISSSPFVAYSTITGNSDMGVYVTGGSPVLKGNTISYNGCTRGGIICGGGDPLIEGNLVTHNCNINHGDTGPGISGCSRIIGNVVTFNYANNPCHAGFGAGVSRGDWVVGNLIANNFSFQDYCYYGGSAGISGHTVMSNTIYGNWTRGSGKVVAGGIWAMGGGTVSGNNLVGNSAPDLYNASADSLDASGNWWDTTNLDVISQRIWDYYDDWSLEPVTFTPILLSPNTGAPAFLANLATYPASPVSVGPLTFMLDFSKTMSTTIAPTVTFGISPTYGTHVVPGNWVSPTHWVGTYNVTQYTGDGVQKIRVAGAVGADDGMEIPENTRFTFTIATVGAASINAQPSWSQVRLNWTPSTLPTLAGYNLYRKTGASSTYTKLNTGLLHTTTYTDTAVTNGTTYYYKVKIVNTDLVEANYTYEVSATPNDYTAPTTPVVIDDGQFTNLTTTLHARWSASDPESGIANYAYRIGTTPGGGQVINWTNVGTATEVTRTGLSLVNGLTCYFAISATNGSGISSVGYSDGITVDTSYVTPTPTPTATPTPTVCYDFDGDGQVDVDDIQLVAVRWRLAATNPDPDNNPATPNYETRFDLDRDGDIDIVDIMLVSARWGERCP
jgi:hypothetical protein